MRLWRISWNSCHVPVLKVTCITFSHVQWPILNCMTPPNFKGDWGIWSGCPPGGSGNGVWWTQQFPSLSTILVTKCFHSSSYIWSSEISYSSCMVLKLLNLFTSFRCGFLWSADLWFRKANYQLPTLLFHTFSKPWWSRDKHHSWHFL